MNIPPSYRPNNVGFGAVKYTHSSMNGKLQPVGFFSTDLKIVFVVVVVILLGRGGGGELYSCMCVKTFPPA